MIGQSGVKTQNWGWRILLLVSVLVIVNAIVLYLFIADSDIVQTAALLQLGVGLLALGAAWEGLRRRPAWAWTMLWALVLTLFLVGAHIFMRDDAGVGSFYLGLATVTLAGQLLAREPSADR